MNSHGGNNPFLTVLVIWLVLMSVGPLLVVLFHAAVPLVIAAGLVFVAVRLTLYFTRRW